MAYGTMLLEKERSYFFEFKYVTTLPLTGEEPARSHGFVRHLAGSERYFNFCDTSV
jgi:hypothetical protein